MISEADAYGYAFKIINDCSEMLGECPASLMGRSLRAADSDGNKQTADIMVPW